MPTERERFLNVMTAEEWEAYCLWPILEHHSNGLWIVIPDGCPVCEAAGGSLDTISKEQCARCMPKEAEQGWPAAICSQVHSYRTKWLALLDRLYRIGVL